MRTILQSILAALLSAVVLGQGAPDVAKFGTEFQKAFEFKDDKALDKLLKSTNDMPAAAMQYFQELRVELWSGKADRAPKCDMIKAAWKRVFENSPVLEKLERWIESQDQKSFNAYLKAQSNVDRSWRFYQELTQRGELTRQPYDQAARQLRESAELMRQTGHKVEAAESWKLLAICLFRVPERSLQDRKDTIFALEQYVDLRKEWEWTQDAYFTINQNTLKGQKQELEAKSSEADKRKAEGYKEGAKGVDALVMPGIAEALSDLAFVGQEAWEDELDYCQRGGPIPGVWWGASFGKDTKDARVGTFRRGDLSVMKLGAAKFGVSTLPSDPKRTQECDAGNKAKPSKFFLDPDHKVPYAMFFWLGTDRERLGEAEVNLAPSEANTTVYYRSAASWTTTVGTETVTLYDDNCSGYPADGDAWETPYTMHTLGYAAKGDDGQADPRTRAPLFDSMRIGKGPRQPFSEFVHLAAGWQLVRRNGDRIGVRPLNPEYLKLGKVKLVWSGPKPTAPVQLVISGRGDFKTAHFDVASGKEIEVPGGEYSVAFGRIVQGKGARTQMGTIYGGDSKPFVVEPGKTYELKMGAPFALDFDRKGTASEPEIDGARIRLKESSGCVIAELHGLALAPEVVTAKAVDGKGAKVVGKFLKCTDAELLNTAAVKLPDIGMLVACLPVPEGGKGESLVLKVKIPAGHKVGLTIKKHPLFGKLDSTWRGDS